MTLCVSCVAGAEGLRTAAYRDPVGIPTVCFGETRGVKLGDTATPEECKAMLGNRVVDDFGPGVDKCVHHELPPGRKAAYTSFAYNAGVAAFCGSSMARLENAGKPAEACDALLKWDKMRVAGVMIYSPGLHNRREKERELCLQPSD